MHQQKVWDSYSRDYISFQKNPSIFYLTLSNMLRIHEANSILDAGCGGGYLHQYILQQRKPTCQLDAFDFSLEMVKLTAARMLKYLKNPLNGQLDQLTDEEINNVDLNEELFAKNYYKIFQADIQNLDQIKNDTYDIYIANLVLHLVEQKDETIKEAFRVLKPGGKIGLTIPPMAGNVLWSLISECALKAQIIQSAPQQTSELETKEGMIQFLKKFGFMDILCWTETIPFDLYSIDESYIMPHIKGALGKASKEQKDCFYNLLNIAIENKLSQNQPLTVEGLQIIARKSL